MENIFVIKLVKITKFRKPQMTALNFFEIGNYYVFEFSALMLSYIIILIQLN